MADNAEIGRDGRGIVRIERVDVRGKGDRQVPGKGLDRGKSRQDQRNDDEAPAGETACQSHFGHRSLRSRIWTVTPRAPDGADRKSAGSGKSVSVRVHLGGRRIKKKKTEEES